MPTTNFKVGEMLHERKTNSKTWMNFDGSYTTEVHPAAVHFVDENGNFQNINTDLYDEADFDVIDDPVSVEGVTSFKQTRKETRAAKKNGILDRSQHNFRALRVPFDVQIPRNFQRGYTIGKGEDKLTFKPVKGSPSTGEMSNTDRSAIVYQDVWNDTDVELKVQRDGIKETLYLKTDKAPSSFSFEVKGRKIDENFSAGALKLEPAWLIDAVGTYRDVEQKVVERDGKVYVELNAPVDGLVYPIEIDPTVTIAANQADWVTASYRADGTTETQLRHGELDGFSLIGFIKFNNSIFPMKPGDVVISATLDLTIVQKTGDVTTVINRQNGYWDSPSDFSGVGNSLVGDFSTAYEVRKSTAGFGEGSVIKYDIQQFVDWWFNGVYNNNGLRLQSNSNNLYTSYESIYSSPYPPKITINYNSKPTRPEITSPNGGESWNSTHTTTWTASTDLDGTPLVYEVQLSTDNGSSWSTIGSGISGMSYTYDFITRPETTMAKIRVRAYDGSIYSDYDSSDGVFTIQHDHAPFPPTNLSPTGVVLDRTKTIRFAWTHSDQNPNDTQSSAELQWRSQGAATWNSISIVGITQYRDLAPNTLTVGGIEWRVRTVDQTGLVGAYSSTTVFSTSNPTALPTIIQPSTIFSGARPVIEWSASDQIAYQIVVQEETGKVVWDTGEVAGDVKARTSGANLANGLNYIVKVRVKGAGGLYSAYTSKTITISYTEPPKPTITSSTVDNERGSLLLEVANPAPTGTEPDVSHNNVLRRRVGETEWTRISDSMPVDGVFTDYTVGSAKPYEYIVQAWGANGTFRNSDILTVTLAIEHAQLALMSDYSVWLPLQYNTAVSQSKGYNRSLTSFAGRKFPLAEYTPEETLSLSTDYIVKTREELETLYSLLDLKETLLYRDREGRRAYVTIGGISEDEIGFGELYGVSFQMDKVSVREEV